MKSSGLYHLKVYSSLKSAHHLKTRSLPLGLFTTSSLLTTSRSARHLKTCSPPQCLLTTSRSAHHLNVVINLVINVVINLSKEGGVKSPTW